MDFAADGYPDLASLLALTSSTALAALTTEQQEAIRIASIATVERYCRQAFVEQGTAEDPALLRVDGNGGARLWLPRRLKQLVAIDVEGSAITTSEVRLTAEGDRLTLISGAPVGYYETAMAVVSGSADRTTWPIGSDNIELGGVWGWSEDEFPAGVALSIALDMSASAELDADRLTSTVETARALGVSQISQGSLSIAFAQAGGSINAQPHAIAIAPLHGPQPAGVPPIVWPTRAGVTV